MLRELWEGEVLESRELLIEASEAAVLVLQLDAHVHLHPVAEEGVHLPLLQDRQKVAEHTHRPDSGVVADVSLQRPLHQQVGDQEDLVEPEEVHRPVEEV